MSLSWGRANWLDPVIAGRWLISDPGEPLYWHWVPYSTPEVGTAGYRAPCGALVAHPSNPSHPGLARVPLCPQCPEPDADRPVP